MIQIIKTLVVIGIIALATSITAVSCGKTAGGGGNNNTANTNTNSGSGGNNGGGSGGNNSGSGGGATCTGICPTTNLVLEPTPDMLAWVKISGSTVTISAAGLAGAITPFSDTDPNNRGFDDIAVPGGTTIPVRMFQIKYPGARTSIEAVLFFINRASVSTNNITMPATSATSCSSSESDDDVRATAGSGTCRKYTAGGDEIIFRNYLGTVFNNTDTANRARGTMRCSTGIDHNSTTIGGRITITDTIIFNRYPQAICSIAVVNNGLGTGVTIDDAWVGNTASTTEVELHAIGINISGKTISQFSSETSYGLTRFTADHDNAAFKRLLQNNPWGELKFKVRIVTAAAFAAL